MLDFVKFLGYLVIIYALFIAIMLMDEAAQVIENLLILWGHKLEAALP